ncbi:MAG: S66 peptidase family protein [Acidobacteriota bacterium]
MPLDRIKPRGLRAGDRVAVVAPSGAVDADRLEIGLQAVRALGLEPVVFPHVLDRDLYMAGSDRSRLEDLNRAFENPDTKAVFCARGGAGALRLLGGLDRLRLREARKILLGCSDITVLLQFFWRQCGLVGFHGPMVAGDFARGLVDGESLRQLFEDHRAPLILRADFDVLRSGRARGPLVGGCLSLIVALEGTRYSLDARGCVLFLEDLATRPYQIERMLTHLKLSGKLEGARAIVFGEMKDCGAPPGVSYTLKDVIARALEDIKVPVVLGFPSGHVTQAGRTLPIGVEVTLDTDAGTLTIEEEAVDS